MAAIKRNRKNKNKQTFYLVAFFCLVAFLSSEFSGWGMTGIFFSLVFSIIALVGTTIVVKAIGRKTNEMLDGKPNQAEYLLAPGGYRRGAVRHFEFALVARSCSKPDCAKRTPDRGPDPFSRFAKTAAALDQQRRF